MSGELTTIPAREALRTGVVGILLLCAMGIPGAGWLVSLVRCVLVGLALMVHTRPLYRRMAQLETRLGNEKLLAARLADTVINEGSTWKGGV